MEQAIVDAIKAFLRPLIVADLVAIEGPLGPILSEADSIIVGFVLNYVFDKLVKIINFEIVDFATEGEQAAYVEAKKQVLAVQGSQDPVARAKAQAAFSAALKPLIQFDVGLPGVIQS